MQDALPLGASDREVLTWAITANRVLVTNDRNTMLSLAFDKNSPEKSVPGLIVTTNEQSIGSAINDILLIAQCISEQEMRDQLVVYLPLR